MITPTVGRVVWYHPEDEQPGDQPLVAMIAHVHSDSCVNLAIFDPNGNPIIGPPRSIRLVQEGEERPLGTRFCEWMPYQLQQSQARASVIPAAMLNENDIRELLGMLQKAKEETQQPAQSEKQAPTE